MPRSGCCLPLVFEHTTLQLIFVSTGSLQKLIITFKLIWNRFESLEYQSADDIFCTVMTAGYMSYHVKLVSLVEVIYLWLSTSFFPAWTLPLLRNHHWSLQSTENQYAKQIPLQYIYQFNESMGSWSSVSPAKSPDRHPRVGYGTTRCDSACCLFEDTLHL